MTVFVPDSNPTFGVNETCRTLYFLAGVKQRSEDEEFRSLEKTGGQDLRSPLIGGAVTQQ